MAESGFMDVNESDAAVLVEKPVDFNACGGGTGCGIECLLMKRLPSDCGGNRSSILCVGLSVDRNGDR